MGVDGDCCNRKDLYQYSESPGFSRSLPVERSGALRTGLIQKTAIHYFKIMTF